MTALREEALRLAERDIVVIPLHTVKNGNCGCKNPECKSPGKHTTLRTYKNIKSVDLNKCRSYWNKWPNANVGILTGPSGLVIIDIDPRNDGDNTFDKIHSDLKLPELDYAPHVQTGGGGEHYYFRAPAEKLPKRLGQGIDLIQGMGVIVAPPSIHKTGKSYKWDRGLSKSIPNFPAELLKYLAKAAPARQGRKKLDLSSGKQVPVGQRNTVFHSLACSFCYRGIPIEWAYDTLRLFRDQCCENPEGFSDDEIARLVQTAYSSPKNVNIHKLIKDLRAFDLSDSDFRFLTNLAVDQAYIPNPSVKYITENWGLSESTLKRSRKRLSDLGLIDYTPGFLLPTPIAGSYQIKYPWVSE